MKKLLLIVSISISQVHAQLSFTINGLSNSNTITNPTIVNVPAQRSFMIDSNKYITATVICQIGNDHYFMFYNMAATHVATGVLYMQTSSDGINWNAPVRPIIGGINITDIGLIATGSNGNRLFLSYQRNNIYTSNNYTYSDDFGKTWANPVSVGLFGSQVEIAPYGRIIEVANDTLYAPMYANFSVDTSFSFYHMSPDNGVSWQMGDTLKKGLFAGTFPNGGFVDETWLLKVKQGATVNTTSLVAFIRSEKYYGYHYQKWTDSGGLNNSWHDVAREQNKWLSEYTSTSGPNTFPVSAEIVHDSLIYVYVGYRGNNVTGLLSNLRVLKGPIAAYKDPYLFSKPYIIYSSTNFKAEHNDWGYPYPLQHNGQPFVGAYDISVNKMSGTTNTFTKTRVLCIYPLSQYRAYRLLHTMHFCHRRFLRPNLLVF